MNKIDLPEAGKAVSLAFDWDAMEALSAEYGENYLTEISRRLVLIDPHCIRLCVDAMTSKPVDLPSLLKKLPVDDLVLRISDAINLSLTGKRTGE